MKTVLITLLLSLVFSRAQADFDSVSLAAKVRAFDAGEVIVEHDRKIFKVPRHVIIEKDLKAGDAVTLVLKPDELHLLPDSEGRPKLAAPPPVAPTK